MLAKLMALLAATKGATVAAVVVLGAATATVGATSPEVQDTVKQAVEAVTGQTADKNDCDKGQPAVVAQRNAATKLIDAAFQKDHKALEELRGKGGDNKAAADLLKTADEKLKGFRTKALNDVAALTLGREGQNKTSDSTTPTTTTTTTTCVTAPTTSTTTTTTEDAPKTDAGKPDQEGRVTVAERTTLDANIKTIVDKAVLDMAAVVTDAQAKAPALTAPEHGKPADNPSGNASEEHKPTNTPKR
jgi:hypothetical protein